MILIAGSTGFIGSHLTHTLVEKGYRIRCLARSTRSAERCKSIGVEPFPGNVSDPTSLEGAMDGVSTVINLTGIIEEKGTQTFEAIHVEGTRALVNEALRTGVSHFFQQSALGANPQSSARYQKTKALAEHIVTDSGLPHTIFRPSLVIGPNDGFTTKLINIINAPTPFIPVPGPGTAMFQPIYVNDLVTCFTYILEHQEKQGRIYELGGPQQLSYNTVVEALARALGSTKKLVHIPMGIAAFGVRLLENTPWRQATSEQLMLLNQDNVCDPEGVKKEFGFEPITFEEALSRFISPQGQGT